MTPPPMSSSARRGRPLRPAPLGEQGEDGEDDGHAHPEEAEHAWPRAVKPDSDAAWYIMYGEYE